MSAYPSSTVSPRLATPSAALPEAAIVLLETSFAAVAPRAGELVSRFYARLFAEHPELRSMFPKSMAKQEKKLVAALALVVSSARKLDTIEPALAALGAKHTAFGAAPAHYDVVGRLLLETMADVAGSRVVADANGSVVGLEVTKLAFRFCRPVIVRAGADTVTGDIYAIRVNSFIQPTIANITNTHKTIVLQAPALGTA